MILFSTWKLCCISQLELHAHKSQEKHWPIILSSLSLVYPSAEIKTLPKGFLFSLNEVTLFIPEVNNIYYSQFIVNWTWYQTSFLAAWQFDKKLNFVIYSQCSLYNVYFDMSVCMPYFKVTGSSLKITVYHAKAFHKIKSEYLAWTM